MTSTPVYGRISRLADQKSSAEYKLFRDLHAKFHQCASKTLACAMAGNKAGAEALMATSGEFTAVSGQLTTAMMAWKAKVPS